MLRELNGDFGTVAGLLYLCEVEGRESIEMLEDALFFLKWAKSFYRFSSRLHTWIVKGVDTVFYLEYMLNAGFFGL